MISITVVATGKKMKVWACDILSLEEKDNGTAVSFVKNEAGVPVIPTIIVKEFIDVVSEEIEAEISKGIVGIH